MDICEWINNQIPSVANELIEEIHSGFHIQSDDGLNLSGRNALYEILDDLLSALFPGVWSKEPVGAEELNFYINDTLRHVAFRLHHSIKDVLHYHCIKSSCDDCDSSSEAQKICTTFMRTLPSIRKTLMKDITAAYEGDPASQSMDEVVLSYPYIEAIAIHRIAHELYKLKVPLLPRIMAERAHSITGIDIHPGASIKEGFFIDHGTGVVIGETCTIGSNVKIYQGVTLGATSPFDKNGSPKRGQKRHPDIEDDVIIYANAVILGGDTVIGKGSIIGGNAWVIESVPPHSVVYTSFTTEMRSR